MLRNSELVTKLKEIYPPEPENHNCYYPERRPAKVREIRKAIKQPTFCEDLDDYPPTERDLEDK